MNKNKISTELIQRIKQQVRLEDFLAKYLTFDSCHKALCPFHPDKNPSLSIHIQKQYWHCFGCGKGGDVITFLQLIEHISFNEAVERLAARAGIPIPKSAKEQKKIKREYRAKEAKLKRLNMARSYLKQAYLRQRDKLLQIRQHLPKKNRWDSWGAQDYLKEQLLDYRFDMLDQKIKKIFEDFSREEGLIRHG